MAPLPKAGGKWMLRKQSIEKLYDYMCVTSSLDVAGSQATMEILPKLIERNKTLYNTITQDNSPRNSECNINRVWNMCITVGIRNIAGGSRLGRKF